MFRGRSPDEAPQARSGDTASFAAEAMLYVDSLYGAAMRLTRNPADAEDVVQETYLKAFRFTGQFEAGTNLKAWLHTILHNTFLNMRRHAGRDPVSVDSEVVDRAAAHGGHSETPEQILMRDTLDADLQGALDELPEVFRQAVMAPRRRGVLLQGDRRDAGGCARGPSCRGFRAAGGCCTSALSLGRSVPAACRSFEDRG